MFKDAEKVDLMHTPAGSRCGRSHEIQNGLVFLKIVGQLRPVTGFRVSRNSKTNTFKCLNQHVHEIRSSRAQTTIQGIIHPI